MAWVDSQPPIRPVAHSRGKQDAIHGGARRLGCQRHSTWRRHERPTHPIHTERARRREAQALATRIADLAEPQFHHPEITFGWDNCRVEFQTRNIRGLHENDFIMAAKVNELHKGASVAEQGED